MAQKKARGSAQEDKGKQPHSIQKETPRRSARISQLQKEKGRKDEQAFPLSSTDQIYQDRIGSLLPQTLQSPTTLDRSLKKEQEASLPSTTDAEQPPSNQPQTSSPHSTPESEPQDEAEGDRVKIRLKPVDHWVRTAKWPSEYFQRGSQAGQNLVSSRDASEGEMPAQWIPIVQWVEINGVKYPRPSPKPPRGLSKSSELALTSYHSQTRSNYRDSKYEDKLAAKGSYMMKSRIGISNMSTDWCTKLSNSAQTVPEDSLFRHDIFEDTCEKIADKNEARIVQDIGRLIVPSAETLATEGARNLDCLIETVKEAWEESIPVEGPRPQPDYAVGFRPSAFTNDQLKTLRPFIGGPDDTSYFVATCKTYFPFLTCEVKSRSVALAIAERQNAHSMTLAVRGVVELFRLLKRAEELHQEILGFSFSHNHESVTIYGHYPLIDGDKTTFHRHQIRIFTFVSGGGANRWTAYRFTRNIYDLWVPAHLQRICSVIDQLPADVNFERLDASD